MGRHNKAVLTGAGIDRRDTGYYSTPAPVAEFFGKKLLSLNPAPKLVFDPCAGRGELLAPFRDCGGRPACGVGRARESDHGHDHDIIQSICQHASLGE